MKNILEVRGRKGILPFGILIYVVIALIVVYLILLLPFPSFIQIRAIINYFIFIIIWIIIQVGFVYGYIYLGRIVVKSFGYLKQNFAKLSFKIHKYIILHN